ncbi:short-chain dehydrogenase [Pandoraea iniqua]|uniref:SDR family oxidoreductase n=1 Tax=Pandoraea iniqua TaxID=2508288 RepID=UPI00124087C3|nr:SDR family oxidoreductase [Pandoraea iniqua]VVE21987.1 short-chain dehydrogenase [Pandoraea iniqua]
MPQQTFLVTGATRGIGFAISALLAEQGHRVVGIARHTADVNFPGTLVECDLADVDQTGDALRSIGERFEITGIVNNAGIASPQPLEQLDFATLQQVFDLNVRSAIQVTQHFVGAMKARRYGRIVNIASRAIYGGLDRTAYAAAKSALVGCTRAWALELAEYGITANAVAPGPVETELFRQSRPVGSEAERRILATIPMRRLGEPAEIASAAVFFLSESASFVTGQVLGVDGGGSLGGRS